MSIKIFCDTFDPALVTANGNLTHVEHDPLDLCCYEFCFLCDLPRKALEMELETMGIKGIMIVEADSDDDKENPILSSPNPKPQTTGKLPPNR